ncbi:hypothetical protein MTO96_028004 [Rhipicephalus appendiculatus]
MVSPVSGEANADTQDSLQQDANTTAACTELTNNFYIWNSSWWFWPEFKNGRIFRMGNEFKQHAECDRFSDDRAECNVKYMVFKLRYRFNVAVKDPKLEERVQHSYPLLNVEAGYMNASVAAGPITMKMKKDCGGEYFLPVEINIGKIQVKDVVFDNFTATWRDKVVDTKDAVFQCRLREHLAYVVHKYFDDMSSGKPVPKEGRKWMEMARNVVTFPLAAVIPVAPLVNEQVDRVLEPGVLCDVISTAGCVEPLRDFYIWNRTWWFWPEFYGGEISGLGRGLKRRGDCAYELGNANVANCEIGHTDLWVRYLWRVGVKNRTLEEGHQQDNPRAVIEQGFLMATVAEGTMRMKLKRDPMLGKFRVHRVTPTETEIEDVVFGNASMTWRKKKVNTNAPEFQWRLRDMLAVWVEYYFERMTFKDIFNKALTTVSP